jgi:hypothetical protein
MIRAEVTENGVRLVGALPADSVAYVDHDWLPRSSASVPWIAVSPDGELAWCNGPPVRVPSSVEPDTAAALCLLAVAREAAAAVEDLLPGSVEVTGSGLIARQIRILIGDAAAPGVGSSAPVGCPGAIVDTTGDPAVIVSATRRLADLGTLVLAGETLGRRTEMNIYSDVHARGLTLVGVAPPLHDGKAFTNGDNSLGESCRESPVRVSSGALLPAGATWYRISR